MFDRDIYMNIRGTPKWDDKVCDSGYDQQRETDGYYNIMTWLYLHRKHPKYLTRNNENQTNPVHRFTDPLISGEM